jgi:hypothetical protein
MNTHGEVVFCLIGETCLIWIFVMTMVVCGEIVSSPCPYDYEVLILHKRSLENYHHPLLSLRCESILILFSPMISLVSPISKSHVPFNALDGEHQEP